MAAQADSSRFVLLGLFAGALSLRPFMTAVGPLLPEIQSDLALSGTASGLIATIPVLCIGLLAPAGRTLALRIGTRGAFVIALLMISLLGVARALAPTETLLLLMTVGLGFGVALGGVVPPMLIKERIRSGTTTATGVFATGMIVGGTLASAAAVPLSDATGSWRGVMLILAVIAGISCVVVARAVRPMPSAAKPTGRSIALPWGRSLVWLIAVVFGLQALLYWGLAIWIPVMLVSWGWTEADAGSAVAIYQATGIITVIAWPLAADRFGSLPWHLVATAICLTIATLALVAAPQHAIAWIVIAGLASGATLPLALQLPIAFSRDAAETGGITALMLLAGYTIASLGPVLAGLVFDLAGGATPTLLVLASIAVAFGITSAALSRRRTERVSE